jgi:hypothetical protein
VIPRRGKTPVMEDRIGEEKEARKREKEKKGW